MRRLVLEVAVAAVEPEAILHDRTAERDAPVVGLEMPGFCAEVRVQRLDLVVRLSPLDHSPAMLKNAVPAKTVAARARDDVHHRPADVALAEAAAHGDRDFLGVDRVVDVRRERRRCAPPSTGSR